MGKRWLNLLLWGLGDRTEGRADYKSNLLLFVDILVWAGTLLTGLPYGPFGFFVAWLAFPLLGHPAYWLVTQLGVGYVLMAGGARESRKGGPRPLQAGVDSEEP